MAAKKKEPVKKLKVEEIEESEEEKESYVEEKEVKTEEKIVEEPNKGTTEDALTKETPTSTPKPDQQLTSFKLADIDEKAATESPTEETSKTEPQTTEPEKLSSLPEVKTQEPIKEEATKTDAQEWLKDVEPDKSEEKEEGKGSKKKLIFIILILVVIVAVIVGGVYYYQTTNEEVTNGTTVNNETQVLEPEPTAVPTEVPEQIDASEYSVNILNGSGIAGEAGKVEALLSDAGFESIDTGNAGSYDYVETEVAVKEDTPDGVYDLIKESLEGSYIVTKADVNLNEDSEYDVVVTVGSKKVEAEVEE